MNLTSERLSGLIMAVMSCIVITVIATGMRSIGDLEKQSALLAEVDSSALSYEEVLLYKLPDNIRSNAEIYLNSIIKISKYHRLDPLWVMSIVWTESHFKHKAKSHVGAKGLMQLMPKTRKYVYNKYKRKGKSLITEAWKVSKNKSHIIDIEIGVIYLKNLLKRFGSRKLATIAYNMGPTWTSRKLRRNVVLGTKNIYLAKVDRAFKQLQ